MKLDTMQFILVSARRTVTNILLLSNLQNLPSSTPLNISTESRPEDYRDITKNVHQ